MRGIEIAGYELVAYRSPRRLFQQLDREAVRVAEFEQLRGDERRGIAERDEAQTQVRFFELARVGG